MNLNYKTKSALKQYILYKSTFLALNELLNWLNSNNTKTWNSHAESHTQQDRQREPSVPFIPHFPPSSGGIACLVAELNVALCLDTRAKNANINVNKYFISSRIEPSTSWFYSRTLCSCATTGLLIIPLHNKYLKHWSSKNTQSSKNILIAEFIIFAI